MRSLSSIRPAKCLVQRQIYGTLSAFGIDHHKAPSEMEAHHPYAIMKTRFQTFQPLQVPGRALLAAVAVLALSTAQLTAGDEKPTVPASTRGKLDKHLVLGVKKSRGESPFDKPTTLQPDVYQSNGRVLVEIEGSASKELSDQVTALGG